MIDWNRAIFLLTQLGAVVVLGVLVALDHDSTITDAMLAVVGSVAGVSLYQVLRKPPTA